MTVFFVSPLNKRCGDEIQQEQIDWNSCTSGHSMETNLYKATDFSRSYNFVSNTFWHFSHFNTFSWRCL